MFCKVNFPHCDEECLLCKNNQSIIPAWHSCSKVFISCHDLFVNLKFVDMKLKAFVAVAAIVIFTACGTPYRATDVNGVVVSYDLQRSFTDQYPTATAIVWDNYDPNVVVLNDWELSEFAVLDASDYVVTFDMDGEKYYAWYDSDGTWVGTAYVVSDYTKLPSAVNATLNTQFPSYRITNVHREFKKDRVAYEIVLKNDDTKVVLLVDNEGNIIKQKSKTL